MLYENICRLAEKKGMSIHQLEVKAGVVGMIGRWRTFDPQLRNLRKVADALGVSVATLLREEKEKPSE